MAEETTELERIYTIPLRRAHHGTRSKRADRAVRDMRDFLQRHMKSDHIWIASEVNEVLWSRGKYTIPSRIRVRATRFKDGVVEVTLPETEAAGSIREAIAERLEKAAETPILAAAPTKEEGEEEEEEHVHVTRPVTDVKGIGPVTAEKLAAAGIATVADLAHADAAEVAKATEHSEEVAAGWIEEAGHLAHAPEEGAEDAAGDEGEQGGAAAEAEAPENERAAADDDKAPAGSVAPAPTSQDDSEE